jgi:hypothetical protein
MLITLKNKNGIKANQVLNQLADKLDKKYKFAKNIKRGFDMGYDGVWEFVIQNTKTNKAIVLKQSPEFPNKQLAFVYATSFSSQPSHDVLYDINNKDLMLFVEKIMPHLSK